MRLAAAVLAGGPVPSRGVGSLRVNGVDVSVSYTHLTLPTILLV